MKRLTALTAGCLLLVGVPGVVRAQGAPPPTDLALLIPGLFGPKGLVVDSKAVLPDGSTHSGHFNSDFQTEFTQFNIALASQLAAVSLPSPASGYTYAFDPTLGVFQRSTQSFGPILADRAETIGKGKFTFGFNFQRFTFDTIEGLDLNSVPAVFTHDDAQLGGGRSDIVTTVNSISTQVSQFNSFFTYGISKQVDVSLALPVIAVDMNLASVATIHRIGTASNPAIHYFADASGGFGDTRTYTSSGSASGLGDVILRVKASAPKSGPTTLALTVDTRFPTGDERNLLGSGAWGVRPTIILSWATKNVAPHVNVAYQWNGQSILGGDVATSRKADLPDQFFYTAGIDVGLTKWATLAADFLGQRVIDSPRLQTQTFIAANGQTFPQIGFARGSFDVSNGSVGFKINAGGSVLVDFNVLFKLNDAGLRDKLTPLLGFEYSF
jgi:hypothetical protein